MRQIPKAFSSGKGEPVLAYSRAINLFFEFVRSDLSTPE